MHFMESRYLSFRLSRIPFLLSLLQLISLHAAPSSQHVTRATSSTLSASPSNPTHVDPEATWGDPALCPVTTFVRGFRQWQDDNFFDRKGLTKIEFHCVVPRHRRRCHRGRCRWIHSGIDAGKQLQERHCRHHRQFVVGISVIFGGPQLGAVEVRPICDVPNWPATEEGRRGETKPRDEYISHTLPIYNWREHGRTNRWEEGGNLLCHYGHAVCGINTKVEHDGPLTDGSGVNEVQIMCCPFPDL